MREVVFQGLIARGLLPFLQLPSSSMDPGLHGNRDDALSEWMPIRQSPILAHEGARAGALFAICKLSP